MSTTSGGIVVRSSISSKLISAESSADASTRLLACANVSSYRDASHFAPSGRAYLYLASMRSTDCCSSGNDRRNQNACRPGNCEHDRSPYMSSDVDLEPPAAPP